MLGKTVELVGGPMDGERCKAKLHAAGELVFLPRRSPDESRPFVHVYASPRFGEDFGYQGVRDYQRGDAGRIMGTVP